MERGVEEFVTKIGYNIAHKRESCYQLDDWLKAHQTALLEAVREEVSETIINSRVPNEETYGVGIRETTARLQSSIDIETIINKAIGV